MIDNGTVSLTEKVTGYKGLALSDEVDLGLPYLAGTYNNQYTTDLKLSALAHVDKISLSNSIGLSGKLPLVSIDCDFGDLLTATWEDLDLSALAHRNDITEAHIVGTLDFPTKIRNYTDTLDERYLLLSATRTTLGGMKTGFFEPLHNTDKNYAVKLDLSSNAYVHVPWTDTTFTLPAATLTALGGVKTGYAASGRNYAVQISGDKAFVYVPWTDTNTTYTAGTGIKITGTTISLANPTPASSIKYSGMSSIQVSGTVYNKSAHTKSVSYSRKNYRMYYDSWTAGNDCIVTVYVSLPMNISSCGTPCKREIYLQPSGGAATSIYSTTTNSTCTMPLILKAGDTIQITGACGSGHGTAY